MKTEIVRRSCAFWLAILVSLMTFLPYLPGNLLDSWGFGLVFVNSGVAGHPYLKGTAEGENRQTWFLCLNEGASAHSNYDYSKINADVSYSEGTAYEKQLFWAYIGAFGSADGDESLSQWVGGCSKNDAKQVAWKNGVPAWVSYMANDGFMGLEKIPAGCMRPNDIFELVSNYDAPEHALSLAKICDQPGHISAEKLYTLTGLDSWETFQKYCTLEVCGVPDGLHVSTEYNESGIMIGITDSAGLPVAGSGYKPSFRVVYDPSIFRVVKISGRIEYFKCKVPGSQQLARASGHAEFSSPYFYLGGAGGGGSTPGGGGSTPGGGGSGGEISVTIYEHQEIFESNYIVDLTKKDYETAEPLEGSTWQVLEQFPDQNKLTGQEDNGNLREQNMREKPTSWEDWLIFETDMKTDENGYLRYQDTRYYDYDHKYCDGHPKPEEPDSDGDDDADDEYEALMEEWEAAVEECSAKAESSNGTFHHWLTEGDSAAGEAEAFEASGCRENRDRAYENFINLRYSYTFREEEPRDGYIIHGQNGHPDDVPIEIITIAASEAEQPYEWSSCSNEEIRVTGYVRDLSMDANEDSADDEDTDEAYEAETFSISWEPVSVTEKLLGYLQMLFGGKRMENSKDARVYLKADENQGILTAASEKNENENADEDAEKDDSDEPILLINDLLEQEAGAADVRKASESNAAIWKATASNASLLMEQKNRTGYRLETKMFASELAAARSYVDDGAVVIDSLPGVEEGPHDRVAHSWIVYDHRIPGEVYFNKRDVELREGECAEYDAYGDTQGDATLEGAVYGLFAAADIYGPDTQRGSDGSVKRGTGIIFDANDLVAVSVTDKNGDGAFLAITEKPHSRYNYQTGKIEYSGKPYPGNLYDLDGYRKEYDEETSGRIYRDNQTGNGDFWIGRPLIMGSYYIKELTRSEGYELSISGKNLEISNAPDAEARENYGEKDALSNPEGDAWIKQKIKYAATFPEGNAAYGNRENLLTLEIALQDAENGCDVVLAGLPENAEFYMDEESISPVKVKVPTGGIWVDAQEEPFYETAKERIIKRDSNGNPIVNPAAVPNQPVAYAGTGYEAELLPETVQVSVSDLERYQLPYENTEENFRYVKYELEQMLRGMGMETPVNEVTGAASSMERPVFDEASESVYGMPEVVMELEGVTTNQSLIQTVLDYLLDVRVFTRASLQSVQSEDGKTIITAALGLRKMREAIYETDKNGNVIAGYLFKENPVTHRYCMKQYTAEQIRIENRTENGKCRIFMSPDYQINSEGEVQEQFTFRDSMEQYLYYEPGEVLYDYCDHNGIGHEKLRRKVYEPVYEEKILEEETYKTGKVQQVKSREEVVDFKKATYVFRDEISGQYVLHVGGTAQSMSGVQNRVITVALDDGKQEVTEKDIQKIGENNVWGYQKGDVLPYAEYLDHIKGIGAVVSTAEEFSQTDSYIRAQFLIGRGKHDLCEDGNTRQTPNPLSERVIKEQIKVTKDIDQGSYQNTNSYAQVHEDWFTKLFGGFFDGGAAASATQKMDNFRFKVYLKSNLERLYRDSFGTVIWKSRNGEVLSEEEVRKENQAFPELVRNIYTEQENDRRYRILETITRSMENGTELLEVESYNYDKFFDALAAANHDLWDDAAPTYTSSHPLGNAVNLTGNTLENLNYSDAVRQFAIDWYLDDAVKNQTKKETAFSEELYDAALNEALKKAEDYLKPFFKYDLDELYAIAWDSETDGGLDHDRTTLSADLLCPDTEERNGYYFGTSKYLPYGDYVVAEQQPRYAELNDFANRHYKKDKPKEIHLPQVYADYEGSQKSPELLNSYYLYHADMETPVMEKLFRIRFLEEAKERLRKSDRVQYRNAFGDAEFYKYGVVSETAGTADQVPYKGVLTMQGKRTAYDGKYAPMLVPWSVIASMDQNHEIADAENEATGESQYRGYGYIKFRNRFYTAKLRIEKLDSETKENILHEGALFSIYAAKRTDAADGEGEVQFYEQDTMITGTREFLEAMCAESISPIARRSSFWDRITGKLYGVGTMYTGIVAAGTPICEESERIALGDRYGNQTAVLKSYSTVRDGQMAAEQDGQPETYQYQTVGYLETPQPLGAGVYVICEERPPSGYVRSRPTAVEIYSDKVAYYKESCKGTKTEENNAKNEQKVLAAIYEYETDMPSVNQNKPQDDLLEARIYIENVPIQLETAKYKESSKTTAMTTPDKTVTYKVSGRVEGSLGELQNDPELVLAYDNGVFQGYGWKKGTPEMLAARKKAGEQVELVYTGKLFSGYGYVTRTLGTAEDENAYVAGAKMTLYDAIKIQPSGDTEDHAYEGVVIERNSTGNITRMYVKEGYAGEKVDYVREKDENGNEYCMEYQTGVNDEQQPVMTTGAVWTAVTLKRHDTDILYYDFDQLDIGTTKRIDGRSVRYGYDRQHGLVSLETLTDEAAHVLRTDSDHSIFIFKGGVPYLELSGGDFTKLKYSSMNKILEIDEKSTLYHLDKNGHRDALADPYTGMAYVLEEAEDGTQSILVWPVNLRRDVYGNIISRDKITTSRLAEIGTEGNSYLTGSWKSENGEESHQKATIVQNIHKQNLNEEVLSDQNNGAFEKRMTPVYDRHGLPVYYEKSEEQYEKGTELYDRNGDFVRYQNADQLESYNQAAYRITEHEELFDSAETEENQTLGALYHRKGEAYLTENTWLTSDRYVNDPFQTVLQEGQKDILKRVPAGHYIMEELKAPDGYLKGLPVGVTVEERAEVQSAQMIDKTTKVEISKLDGVKKLEQFGASAEYSYAQVPGAVLALYRCEISEYTGKEKLVLQKTWTTEETPCYLEGLVPGNYLLKELKAPEGFLISEPQKIEIRDIPEVQSFALYNDHTKLEIYKYHVLEGKSQLLEGAEFTLYDGNTMLDRWESRDMRSYREFIPEFEAMYRDYGTRSSNSLRWSLDGKEHRAFCVSVRQIDDETEEGDRPEKEIHPTWAELLYRTDEGKDIRITVYGERQSFAGKDFTFEYQFEYQKLPAINENACAYFTLEGMRRYNYLPLDKTYRLVETKVPSGYAKTQDLLVTIKNTDLIQRVSIENTEGKLLVSKSLKTASGELKGAHLALYRADESGGLTQSESYLVSDWVTGEDGVYTELDEINRKIPEGFAKGDLKPHEVHRLDTGEYWLAELESPAYFNIFEPVKVNYEQGGEIRIVRTVDTLAEGEVTIYKRSEDGTALRGAVFEITAYQKTDLKTPVLSKQISGVEAAITLKHLPIGECDKYGNVTPYLYKLQEITPPEGYAVNPKLFQWEFSPDNHGVSYQPQESAKAEVTVIDQKTKIKIGKQQFDFLKTPERENLFVSGAELAVYEVTGADENGNLQYDEKHPAASWISKEKEQTVEGLIAGHTYMLKECSAPEGYLLMEPILFTLSADGRTIRSAGNEAAAITVHYKEQKAASEDETEKVKQEIEAISVRGRYVTGTEQVLFDAKGRELSRWQTSGKEQVLTELEDGKLYTLKEITRYSDGGELETGKITKVFYADDEGNYVCPGRNAVRTQLLLEKKTGEGIAEIEVRPEKLETLLANENYQNAFQPGESYVLTEVTEYSDHVKVQTARLEITLGEISNLYLAALNRQTHIVLSKVDITDGQELPGCEMELQDSDGNVLETWISEDQPHEITGVLIPGKEYVLVERQPADGYQIAEAITFTVSEHGITGKVVMADKPVEPEKEKPKNPGKPSHDSPVKKEVKGWISTNYTREQTGGGVLKYPGDWEQQYRKKLIKLPRLRTTGDESRDGVWLMLMLLSFAGVIGILIHRYCFDRKNSI